MPRTGGLTQFGEVDGSAATALFSMNGVGQLVFGVSTQSDSWNNRILTHIYGYDPSGGVVNLATVGGHLAIPEYAHLTITSLNLVSGGNGFDGKVTAISPTGGIVFGASLSDGTAVPVFVQIPAPSCAAVLALAGILAHRRRR